MSGYNYRVEYSLGFCSLENKSHSVHTHCQDFIQGFTTEVQEGGRTWNRAGRRTDTGCYNSNPSSVSSITAGLLSHGRDARGAEPLSLRTALGWADRPTIYLLSSSWLLPLSGQGQLHKTWTPVYIWAVFWLHPGSIEGSQDSCGFSQVIPWGRTQCERITEGVLVLSSVPGRLN